MIDIRSLFNSPVQDIGLPMRVANGLEAAGFRTVWQVLHTNDRTLRKIPQFGPRTIKQIKDACRKHVRKVRGVLKEVY